MRALGMAGLCSTVSNNDKNDPVAQRLFLSCQSLYVYPSHPNLSLTFWGAAPPNQSSEKIENLLKLLQS